MYSRYIIQRSAISNYSVNNQRGLVLDTAENLTQIGQWTLNCFAKEQQRIALYLALTRKNLTALASFPSSSSFLPEFKKFCNSYDKLEEEYVTGIVDRSVWANGMLTWGTTLLRISEFI